jgi:hypothetical protein
MGHAEAPEDTKAEPIFALLCVFSWPIGLGEFLEAQYEDRAPLSL